MEVNYENTSNDFVIVLDSINYSLVRSDGEVMTEMSWTVYPTVGVLVLASFLGTLGNIFILLAIVMHDGIRSKESIYFGSMALCDLYVTVIADPMSIIGK